MPWKVSSAVSERQEFVTLARTEGANIRALCRAFHISPTVAYKWIARAKAGEPLEDRSRRPHTSPSRTADALERAVLEVRDRHPAWGGRKVRKRLIDLGHLDVPSASTVTEILRRHARLDPQQAAKHTAFRRFEHPEPNELWQMDFKGEFALRQGWCYPLTILDDHSRFAVCLRAQADVRTRTTQEAVRAVFRQYGMPRRITSDNGRPWGAILHGVSCWTHFSAWLIRVGVEVTHSRPHHPQTQGKDERFHRTLGAELLSRAAHDTLEGWQAAFDAWREVYNGERPHDALGLDVPASRYRASERSYPERLEAIEYAAGDEVRLVKTSGQINYRGRLHFVGRAFGGERVGLRPTSRDGVFDVYYCHQRVAVVDLHVPVVWR
jgi:transposase InsO family protein